MSEALVSISSTKKMKVFKWGEGDGSVSKVLALQAKDLSSIPGSCRKKKQGMVVDTPSTGEAQTDGSLGFTGQMVSLMET